MGVNTRTRRDCPKVGREGGGARGPPPSTSFTAFGILCASTSASRQVHCVPNSLRVSGDTSSRWDRMDVAADADADADLEL